MKTKLCSKCSQTKSIKDFYNRGPKRKYSAAAFCKECFNKLCCERWKQRKLDAIKYMGSICTDCKQSYHPNVYDFHHLGDKDYDWSKLRLRSWETILSELQKCILLCSNCHRIRHAND